MLSGTQQNPINKKTAIGGFFIWVLAEALANSQFSRIDTGHERSFITVRCLKRC